MQRLAVAVRRWCVVLLAVVAEGRRWRDGRVRVVVV